MVTPGLSLSLPPSPSSHTYTQGQEILSQASQLQQQSSETDNEDREVCQLMAFTSYSRVQIVLTRGVFLLVHGTSLVPRPLLSLVIAVQEAVNAWTSYWSVAYNPANVNHD